MEPGEGSGVGKGGAKWVEAEGPQSHTRAAPTLDVEQMAREWSGSEPEARPVRGRMWLPGRASLV